MKNALGTSLELWPADLPKVPQGTGRGAEGALARRRRSRCTEIVARHEAERAGDPLTPVVLRRGIHSDQYDYLKEHQREFPGVELVGSYLRSYPYKSLAAQVLGYVGPITQAELKAAKSAGYKPQDVMGQAGIEQTYDRYLKGKDGSDQLTVNSLGQPDEPDPADGRPAAGQHPAADDRHPAPAGGRAGAPATRSSPPGRPARRYADGGAIVALDPRNGAVLAMASNPTYQPSVYVSRDPAKLAPLQKAKLAAAKNYPGLNRAIDGFYPPGSVWKPVTALAAMQEGIIVADREPPLLAGLRLLPAALPQLGPVRQPADGARPGARPVVRHLLLPARRLVLRASPPAAARRCSSGRRASASARRPASTSAPRTPGSSRRPTGAAATSAARPAPATSTGSGSRATRSSSRSARATSR